LGVSLHIPLAKSLSMPVTISLTMPFTVTLAMSLVIKSYCIGSAFCYGIELNMIFAMQFPMPLAMTLALP
jgi:hypothetical protein